MHEFLEVLLSLKVSRQIVFALMQKSSCAWNTDATMSRKWYWIIKKIILYICVAGLSSLSLGLNCLKHMFFDVKKIKYICIISDYLSLSLERRFCVCQNIIVTNFVIVSGVSIKRVDCIMSLIPFSINSCRRRIFFLVAMVWLQCVVRSSRWILSSSNMWQSETTV